MQTHFTIKSSNAKTGPIPTSISPEKTCPKACPFKNNGCYAELGPLSWHWKHVSSGARGSSFKDFLASVTALPAGQLWRHNVAGDLAGTRDGIDRRKLDRLVAANKGKRGFTYTHKPMTASNLKAVRHAVANGFTINLSANSPAHADQLAKHKLPMVVVVDSHVEHNTKTPNGRTIVICPATQRDDVTCISCKMCAVANRSIIIGFPAHGTMKKRIDNLLKETA